jgi:acetyl-CoA C-acetyltransferase
MTSSYLISGCRTPIGKYLGGLSSLSAVELGGQAIAEAVRRASLDPNSIDQVIMGQVIQAGSGQAPARQASHRAGLPTTVGAMTVNKVCGSGLVSVMLADMAIRAGEYRRVVAGGMESMSQAPHLLRHGRSGWKYGEQPLMDSIDLDGLRCAQLGFAMGCIAEWVAKVETITREEQDEWAVRSHRLAVSATGSMSAEIVPVTVVEAKKPVVRSVDEGPRPDTSMVSLGSLKPVFLSPLVAGSESAGYQVSVTAGNASTLSDGGAAVVVVDEETLRSVKADWSFRIVGHCHFAGDHQRIFTAPVGAVHQLLRKTNKSVSDVDLFEINEAFAAQTLACIRELHLDANQVNIRGGAIAMGHPLGCSGTRVLVSLISSLIESKQERGIATLCLGGGEAVAMMIERET